MARDPENCGACGKKCAAGEVCSQGTCALSCGGGTTKCGTTCVDTKADPSNCGACGTKCGTNEVCNAGKCASSCSGGTVTCGSACVNTQTDPTNCGGCGTLCKAGEQCTAGSCKVSCQAGLTLCSAPVSDAGVSDAASDGASDAALDGAADASTLGANFCANLQTDNQNCGACGTACGTGTTCVNGACAASCGNGSTLCTPDGGVPYCAVLQSDNKNCGTCGNACTSGTACVAGQCVSPLAGCVIANGLRWCHDKDSCGIACNAVCAKFGLTPVDSTTWFNAQNTTQLCQNISVAFGLGTTVNLASFTYACLEDVQGTHTNGGPLLAPLLCSTFAQCPANHLTNMDQLGVACGPNSRRSICPCL